MRKGFINIVLGLILAGVIIAGSVYLGTRLSIRPTVFSPRPKLLGAVTGSGLFPTSTNNFQDGDIINAGDWNAIENTIGTNNSPTSTTLFYKLTSSSSTDPGHIHTLANGTTGTLAVARGGTGTSTVLSGAVTSNGTTFSSVAPGTLGNVLTSNGSVWLSSSSVSSIQSNLSNSTSTLYIGNSFLGLASSTSFSYTGASSSWVVPSGVTSITITSIGASGVPVDGVGGGGSVATGTIAVTPGATYYYLVGGQGSGATGGFGGGGNGGIGGGVTRGGGGGGGMSWFSPQSSFASSTAVIAAAGGGGGGANQNGTGGGTGGSGDYPNGGTGSLSGGGGGTQSGGGTAGGGNATAGTVGQGGNGANNGGNNGGGGGGGGFFGGGGGIGNNNTIGAGGGGGGSSFLSVSLTATSTATGAIGNGSIVLSYRQNLTSPTGNWSLGVGGHIFTGGNLPTVNSCGATLAGISAAIAGNDTAGLITTGGTTSVCTLNFNQQFLNIPSCSGLASSTSFYVNRASPSTSSVTFGFSAAAPSSSVFSYQCFDY